mgnify:FL=1|tara:strand:- start:360 stop:692 length:333 start_codon:yes stop_codon:yes gene_type:complete
MADKKSILYYTPDELKQELISGLVPEIRQYIEDERQIERSKARKLNFEQACDHLSISRSTLSGLIAKGEIASISLNPDNPRSKKFFMTEDLDEWLESKRQMSIRDIKNGR